MPKPVFAVLNLLVVGGLLLYGAAVLYMAVRDVMTPAGTPMPFPWFATGSTSFIPVLVAILWRKVQQRQKLAVDDAA